MKPSEMNLITTNVTEHLRRKAMNDYANECDENPDRQIDYNRSRKLYESWLVARDAQRLAQTVYADSLSPTAKVGAM